MLALSITLAIIPAAILLRYYLRQDKSRPEPRGLIIRVFLLGILSILPVLIIELILQAMHQTMGMSPLGQALIQAFVVAALTEESMKLLVVRGYAWKQAAFDEVMDGIVYAVVASLGFAVFENIMYVLNGGISTAILRAVTAVPMHALAAGIMGYYVGLAHFDPEHSRGQIWQGLIWAVLVHGAYDFFLFIMPVWGAWWGLMIVPILVLSFLTLKRLIRQALQMDLQAGRISNPPADTP